MIRAMYKNYTKGFISGRKTFFIGKITAKALLPSGETKIQSPGMGYLLIFIYSVNEE